MPAIETARQILADGCTGRVFPSAVAEMGSSREVLWRDAAGTRTFDDPAAVTGDTPYDLASLTKPIVTATAVMALAADDRLTLDDRIEQFFPEWRGADREAVTVRDLLEHASGLPARLVDAPPSGRREFEHDICTMPLEYVPRSRSVYSDLGFILLGFLCADRAGRSLAVQFADVWAGLAGARHSATLTFELPLDRRRAAAPTMPMPDDSRRGRLLAGEVHDNYAAALGGVAGHAGLFGTAGAVGAFARAMLTAAAAPLSAALVREFTRRSAVPGSSRALGWDTMLSSSSCGTRMSPAAYGHVGFTGTSLWIDPVRDRYFVLLTNRACGGGTLEEMRAVRRAFHDALADA